MSSLSGVSVVSPGFVAGLAVVTVTALAATVALLLWLPHRRRRSGHKHVKNASAGSARRWRLLVAALPAVLICQLLVTGLATAKINSKLRFANTLGQVAELASGSGRDSGVTELAPVATPEATGEADAEATGSQTPPAPDPAYVASLKATSEGGNTFKTSFHGPASGITDDVWFWTPRGYSAADGKSYNVLMLLHGVPGTADGVVPGLELGRQLQAAIDDGRLPPTIVAIPSLNADATQRSEPDCADIVGHAKVGTWIQQDVPKMIRATFPGVRTDRQAWALGGVSSGGYCAVWTAIMRSDVYATAASLSGYDVPDVGGLASPELRDANTLSTLVARQRHAPINLWLLGAQDDPLANGTVTALPAAVGKGDTAEAVRPGAGGHSWSLWKEQTTAFLTWWGQRPSVNLNGPVPLSTPTPSPAPTPSPTPTPDASASQAPPAAETPPASPEESLGLGGRLVRSLTQIRGTGVITMACLLTLAATLACIVVPARAAARDGLSGAEDGPGAEAGAARPGRGGAAVGVARAAVRTLLLVSACVLAALLVGLIGNRIGAFYPTWALAWADIGPALR
ncbi:hypothetical protein AIF0345_1330 [Actinomyces israelii]|nr:hypothetical protein AIF0345_1330 [Actinomyces israelii]